jgi:hypothetical protein
MCFLLALNVVRTVSSIRGVHDGEEINPARHNAHS